MHTSTKKTPDSSKPLRVGIETGWDSNVSDCKTLIDKVKNYTNLFIIASRLIVSSETLLNETCDYAYNSSMYFTVYFRGLTTSNFYPGIISYFAPSVWFTSAKERYGDQLQGIYFYDEAAGSQLDQNNDQNISYPHYLSKQPISYSDYADRYYWLWTHPSPDGSVTQVANFTRGLDSSVLTSDYALYWFDYRVGYDTVLSQFGWNNSRQLQVSLIRGAAAAYDKNWGAIITWTYNQPPYLESEGQLYDDMVLAYNSGAKYIAIYDSTKDYQNTTLTEEHFKALQNFWSYTQHNPDKQGGLKADTALVPPHDYAFGFRSPSDSVWRNRQADNWTRKMYNDVTILLEQYNSGLDIVYSDQGFQNSIQSKYSKVLRWPQDFETNNNFSVINLNNGLGYDTIQEALSSYATYAGDNIFVKPGTYHENIIITKSVSLSNQNTNSAIIDGSGNDTALTIVCDKVTMNGFVVQNGGNLSALVGAGILLLNAHNCTLTNNTVHNNYAGIVIANSSGNVLRRNNISNNMVNLVLQNASSNDIDSSNIVNGKPYTVGYATTINPKLRCSARYFA